MQNFSRQYAALLYRYRRAVLFVTFVLTCFFAWHTSKVITLNALENMLPEHDPELLHYQELNKEFGGDFIMMIVFEADEIFKTEMLATIDGLTKAFEKRPEVERVLSLTNATQITPTNDEILIAPLVGKVPTEASELAQLKKNVLADPLYTQTVIHPTLPLSAMYIRMRHQEDLLVKQSTRDAFVPFVELLLQECHQKAQFKSRLAGNVTLEYHLDKSARENQLVTTIFMLLMISGLLYFLFKRLSAILACLLAIALSSVWTTGIIGFLGFPLNFVTALLPPLILVVAVLDCIHIYATFQSLPADLSAAKKITATLDHLLIPCLVTGFTTVVGFGSLVTSDMSALRHFGCFSAFGIASALFIAIGPLPIILSVLPDLQKPQKAKTFAPVLQRAVNFFIALSLRHWKKNLVFALCLLIVMLMGYSRIFIETRPVDFYPKHSQIPQDFYFIDQMFNGSTTSDILVSGPIGIFAEPETLKTIDHLVQATSQIEDASDSLSVVALLKKANQAFHDNDPQYYAIPETRAEVEQLYLFLQGDSALRSMMNSDYSMIRLHQQVKAIGSKNGIHLVRRVRELGESILKAPLQFFLTGSNVVWINMESYIVQSQIAGFACDLAITLLLIFILRSVKWGVLSMVPNLFPVLCMFGVMGWFGIPLNMVTTMVASIAIGLAVDDTVHLMLHIRKATEAGLSMSEAITEAFEQTGPAVISTSLVLAFGFWTLCLTDFIPSQQFGFLGGLTFIFGMIAELMLLPAVLKLLAQYLVPEKNASSARIEKKLCLPN